MFCKVTSRLAFHSERKSNFALALIMTRFTCCFCLCVVILFVQLVQCVEFFSSTAHMESLLRDEEQIIREIHSYIKRQEDRIQRIQRKVDQISAARVCRQFYS